MSALIYLIPAALFLGLIGLVAFLWALRSGQFDDLDGAAQRILFDEDDEAEEAGDSRADRKGSIGNGTKSRKSD